MFLVRPGKVIDASDKGGMFMAGEQHPGYVDLVNRN